MPTREIAFRQIVTTPRLPNSTKKPAIPRGPARGPTTTLCDSEVLTIEIVGEFLGLDEDTKLFAYFRRHYAHFFPNLRCVHRTTFARQAANLWKAKELLWQKLLAETPHDRGFVLCGSMPWAACVFARAYRRSRFEGEAAFGKEPSLNRPSTAYACTHGSAGRGS